MEFGGVIISLLAGVSYSLLTRSVGTISWLAFPCGIVIAQLSKKDGILSWRLCKQSRSRLHNASWLFGLFCFPVTASIYYFSSCYINTIPLLLNFIVLVLSTPFAVIPFKQCLSKSKMFEYFGTQSLYLYLMHGLCLSVAIRYDGHNHGMLFLCFVLGTIILSYLFGQFSARILKTII